MITGGALIATRIAARLHVELIISESGHISMGLLCSCLTGDTMPR